MKVKVKYQKERKIKYTKIACYFKKKLNINCVNLFKKLT